jgi:hypothetical protein
MILTGFVLGCVAIVFNLDRLGGLAAFVGIPALIVGIFGGLCLEDGFPARPFSRRERRRLREEQSRIRLEAEIARMERDAGVGGKR